MEITQEVEFPDISFWQGTVDFTKMSKASGVILRAGQGAYIDSQFEVNRSEVLKNKMNWGIYWFWDDRVSPSVQAEKLVSLFSSNKELPNMGIYCDWESTYGGKFGSIGNVVSFMERVEELLPLARVGMYTGYYFFMQNTDTFRDNSQLKYLSKKPLWLAWYIVDPKYVKIPRLWTKLTFWQYGTPARGSEFGVNSKEIDMNWFNGTQEEFNKFCGNQTTQPPIPPTQNTYPTINNIDITLDSGEKRLFVKR